MTILLRLSDDARLFEVRYVGALDYAMRTRAVEAVQRRLKDGWVKQILIDFSESWPVDPPDPAEVDRFRKTLSARRAHRLPHSAGPLRRRRHPGGPSVGAFRGAPVP